MEQRLFRDRQGFRVPTYGRSNVPQNSILDHAGVWENCNHGYLHEVLIKKEGIAATLAIIYTQVRIFLCRSSMIGRGAQH